MHESRKLPGLRELAGLLGLLLLACCLALALWHLRDLSNMRHLHSIWMALAAYLDQGVFYPPLEADGYYAGTRYMPLVFLLVSALARLVGDYLLAAKLSALLSMVLVLSGVFVAVRRLTGRLTEAVALSALVLALPAGFASLMSPHADALPVGLALWGLLLVDREPARAWRVCLAALLFALALAAKFSAVAGPAAAAVVLWQRGHRRLAVLEVALFAGLAVLEIALFQWASDGRFLDNLRSLGSGGMSFESIRIGPGRLGYVLLVRLLWTPFILVWPVVLFLLMCRFFGRSVEPRAESGSARQAGPTGRGFLVWQWYLLASLAVTTVIFTSPGTDFNHLIEMEAACVLVLAGAIAGLAKDPFPQPPPRSGEGEKAGSSLSASERVEGFLRGLVLVVLLIALWRLVGMADANTISPQALIDALPKEGELLCEDPGVDMLMDRRPVVMDPFSFRVLAERGIIDDVPLAERINRQEFTALVMRGRIDRPRETFCPHLHFGPRVTKAMLRAYRFERRVGNYFIFLPVRTAVARTCRLLPGHDGRRRPEGSTRVDHWQETTLPTLRRPDRIRDRFEAPCCCTA